MQEQQEQKEQCLCVDGDNPLLQEGICSVLRRELPGIRLLEPGKGNALEPALLILCISDQEKTLPLLHGYRERHPALRTILLYDSTPVRDIFSYLSLGCCCVYKATLSAHELVECIRMVENNFFLWDKASVDRLLEEAGIYHGFVACMQKEVTACIPTQREIEIAHGILAGLNNEGLAKRLYLSTGTVKNNIASILEKYNFQNRAQIISLLALK